MLRCWILFLFIPTLGFSQVYDLNPRYVEGEVTNVEETFEIQGTHTMNPGLMKFYSKALYQIRTKMVSKEKTVLEMEIKSYNISSRHEIGNLANFVGLENMPFEVHLTPNAKVLEVVRPKNLTKQQQISFDNLKQFIFNYGIENYAIDGVAVGQKWTEEMPIQVESNQLRLDLIQTIDHTLKSVEEKNKNKYGLVGIAGSLEGSLDEGLSGRLEGTLDGLYTIDLKTSKSISLELEIKQKLLMHSREHGTDSEMDILIKYTRKSKNTESVQ